MKLDDETIEFIQKAVGVAQLAGIDDIIIEPGRIRGSDASKSIIIFQDSNVPNLKLGTIGLTRIPLFVSRLNAAKMQDKFTIEADIVPEKGFVRRLIIKANKIKIDYRCANPAIIKAPRFMNDTMVIEIPLSKETTIFLQKAIMAMGRDVELVSIIGNGDGISFELEDFNKDKFNHVFGEVPKYEFSHKYPVKILNSLFKKTAGKSFHIGGHGVLRFEVDGIGIYVYNLN
jgi:hypothetical protein